MSTGIPHDVIRQKLAQAVEELRTQDLDLWITFVQETASGAERIFPYLSPGNLTWESAVLVTRQGRKEIICGSLDQKDFEDSGLFDAVTPFVADFKEPFLGFLDACAPRTVALNYSLEDYAADGITYGKYIYLESLIRGALPEARIVSADKVIGALFSQKCPSELQAIEEAAAITAEIFKEISAFLKPGLTEKQIRDFAVGRMEARGTGESFPTLVFAGDRGAGMGHSSVTDNDLRAGDLLHVDMGVWVRGYASDMQRTWYLRRPGESSAPAEVLKGFETIARAIRAAGEALKPGVTGSEVDALARGVVTGAGYPEYPHALGHQLGHHVHDGGALLGPPWPRYKKTPHLPVRAGQVFTLEPSLNVPGYGAVGLEDDVVVTAEGIRYLSAPQEEIWYI